jgi:hypothetical protein
MGEGWILNDEKEKRYINGASKALETMLNSQDDKIVMEAITLVKGVARGEITKVYKVILTTPYSYSNEYHEKHDFTADPAVGKSEPKHLRSCCGCSGRTGWEQCVDPRRTFDIPHLMTDNTRGDIENAIPQLIQRLDDSDSYVRRAVVNAMVELAKNGM